MHRTHRAAAVLSTALLLSAMGCDEGHTEDPIAEEDLDEVEDDVGVTDEVDPDAPAYDPDDQPDDAGVAFTRPEAGETVSSPVELEFEVDGVELAEADDPVVGEGHVHVMVDRGCVEVGDTIPGPSDEAEDEGLIHLGDGADTAEVELDPGEHELCAQLGDGSHRAFGQTDEILITVE